MIVIYGNDEDILTQHNQKRNLWTICIPIFISPPLVKEIASVITWYNKYFVPKQFEHPFHFNNSNHWHEESEKL